MAKHIHFHEVTSTNDVAYELALKGAENLTAISADIQTKGRGRRGRVWSTIPSKSLAVSFVIREFKSDFLPYMASLAVLETIRSFIKKSVIKWPNDILIDDKKVSGILIERYTQGSGFFYIIGIGINVNIFDPNYFNETVHATSLEDHIKTPVEIKDVFEKLQKSLSKWLAVPTEGILSAYIENCATIGCHVTWQSDNQTLTGFAKGISNAGSLFLELESGETKEILSGDIISQN